MLALCDIIGVVGAKYLIEQINTLIYENLVKIKAIVVQNKEILQSLRITFDRPEMMKDFYKRLESKILLDLTGYCRTPYKNLFVDCLQNKNFLHHLNSLNDLFLLYY